MYQCKRTEVALHNVVFCVDLCSCGGCSGVSSTIVSGQTSVIMHLPLHLLHPGKYISQLCASHVTLQWLNTLSPMYVKTPQRTAAVMLGI